MIEFNIKESTNLDVALSIGQIFRDINYDACRLLTGIRNLDINGCIVDTANGLVKITYTYHPGNNKVMFDIHSADIHLYGSVIREEFHNLFDPWLHPIKDKYESHQKNLNTIHNQ